MHAKLQSNRLGNSTKSLKTAGHKKDFKNKKPILSMAVPDSTSANKLRQPTNFNTAI